MHIRFLKRPEDFGGKNALINAQQLAVISCKPCIFNLDYLSQSQEFWTPNCVVSHNIWFALLFTPLAAGAQPCNSFPNHGDAAVSSLCTYGVRWQKGFFSSEFSTRGEACCRNTGWICNMYRMREEAGMSWCMGQFSLRRPPAWLHTSVEHSET